MYTSITHVNIPSIRTFFGDLSNIIINKNFDIVAVTETWLNRTFPVILCYWIITFF